MPKYTKQKVENLIAQLPQRTVNSLIDEMVHWQLCRDYCDGITDPHEDQAYQSARDQEIVSRKKQAVELLIGLLKHPDWAVRDDAAALLGYIQSPLAVQSLIGVLASDESRAVMFTAAIALKRIGTPEGIAAAKTWHHHNGTKGWKILERMFTEYKIFGKTDPVIMERMLALAKLKGITPENLIKSWAWTRLEDLVNQPIAILQEFGFVKPNGATVLSNEELQYLEEVCHTLGNS